MRLTTATVLQTYIPWAGVLGLTLKAETPIDTLPGQCLLLRPNSCSSDVLARLALPTARDERNETLDVLIRNSHDARSAVPLGVVPFTVACLGPVGRAFAEDRRSRRALLVDGGSLLAPLHYLARRLLTQGVEVTYLLAAGNASPDRSVALPPEVEVRTLQLLPTDRYDEALSSALDPLVSWADTMYLSLDPWQVSRIAAVVRRQLLQLRGGFAQVMLTPTMLPCGLGACDLCSIRMRDGYRRICRDGPVFDLLKFI